MLTEPSDQTKPLEIIMSATTHLNPRPFINDFEVFVSTASNEHNALKIPRKRFNLADYDSEEAFMAAGKRYAVEAYGLIEDRIELEFYYYDDNIFAGSGLTTRHRIDNKVWDYLRLEYADDITMTIAFIKIFGMEAPTIKECWKLAIGRCVNHYDDLDDFAYAWLKHEKQPSSLFLLDRFNIDTKKILDKAFETYKTQDGWVFSNKGVSGWGYHDYRSLEDWGYYDITEDSTQD